MADTLPINSTSSILFSPPFMSEPTGRGTIGLLISCIVTLTFAVWTAIHPNIIDRPTTLRMLVNKIRYVILALFAPEIVLIKAYGEWKEASRILVQVRMTGAAEILEGAIMQAELLNTEVGVSCMGTNNNCENTRRMMYNAGQNLEAARQSMDTARTLASIIRGNAGPTQIINHTQDDSIHDFQLSALTAATTVHNATSKFLLWLRWTGWVEHTQDQSDRRINKVTGLQRLAVLLQKWWGFIVPRHTPLVDFDLESAFFVAMGGYSYQPTGWYTVHGGEVTLEPTTLLTLLESGAIKLADLSRLKGEVADKKKTDLVAKFIVCLQAGWMVVNCIGRKINNLPITLIELNVVTHVLCAVVMYIFWWRKPHDVGRPISLSPVIIEEGLCALIHLSSRNFTVHASSTVPGPTVDLPAGGYISAKKAKTWEDTLAANMTGLPIYGILPLSIRDNWIQSKRSDLVYLHQDLVLVDQANGFSIRMNEQMGGYLTQQDLDISLLAANELRKPRFPDLKRPSRGEYGLSLVNKDQNPLKERTPENKYTPVHVLTLSLLYSGIHASAWNYSFPTPMERWLWRVSCVLIMTVGIGFVAYHTHLLVTYRKSYPFCQMVLRIQSFLHGRSTKVGTCVTDSQAADQLRTAT